MFILQIIILLYIIFVIYNIIDIQKYNRNGLIIDISDKVYIRNIEKIKEEFYSLNPILIHSKNDKLSLDKIIKINKSYFIEDDKQIIKLNKLKNMKNINIFKNFKICDDLNLYNFINFNLDFFENHLLFNRKNALSIFKNYHITDLNPCKHNINIIYILEGEVTIYLFNPKHKNEIINKKLNTIKKYAHKYILTKDNLLLIPPNWYYIEEINNNVLQYHIDCDNYFTFIYNMIK